MEHQDSDHVETVIVGAGQAGLATAYHLTRRGRDCVVLDRHQRIGDGWRRQWDTLKLYSPAKYDALPGMPFPAPGHVVPGQGRRRRLPRGLRPPLRPAGAPRRRRRPGRGRRRRRRVRRHHDRPGRSGATTWWSRPAPSAARRTCPSTPTSSTRRSCSCTRASTAARASCGDGPVLVVGASHSGTDIAHELAATRPTTLAGRDCGEIPPRLDARTARSSSRCWSSRGRTCSTGARPSAARRWRTSARTAGRCCGSSAPTSPRAAWCATRRGSPACATGCRCSTTARSSTASTVVWATGFRQAFDWVDLPVLRRRRVAARVPRRRRRRTGPVLLRTVVPVGVHLDADPRRRPRRGVRRRPDRGSREAAATAAVPA